MPMRVVIDRPDGETCDVGRRVAAEDLGPMPGRRAADLVADRSRAQFERESSAVARNGTQDGKPLDAAANAC